MQIEPATLLRDSGLRLTRQRVAVISALIDAPHSDAAEVLRRVRTAVGQVSTQAVYDVLNTLTEQGLIRRIQPAGSPSLYELRVGDNHHHVVCRRCGAVADIDCTEQAAPCLNPKDLHRSAPGFVLEEAEITFWGICQACSTAPASA